MSSQFWAPHFEKYRSLNLMQKTRLGTIQQPGQSHTGPSSLSGRGGATSNDKCQVRLSGVFDISGLTISALLKASHSPL